MHRELELETGSGRRFVYATALPVRSPYGNTEETLLMLQDITDLQALGQTREALAASERLFRSTFDRAGIGMVTVSPEGRFLHANPVFCRFIGYSEEELRERCIADVTFPEDLEQTLHLLNEALTSGRLSVEMDKRCLRRDGTSVWARVSATWMLDAEGAPTCCVVFATDITARKLAELALAESEERLRLLIGQMPAVLWTTDRELRFTSSVGGGLESLGLGPGEVVGKTLFEYFGTDDRSFRPIETHLRAVAGESAGYEMTWEGRTFNVRVEPLRGPDGAITGSIGAAHDITERTRTEEALRRSEEQLRHSQKMDAIGNLAGGVAHDFNNLLTGILGQAELLRFSSAPGDRVRESVEMIEKAARRAAQLTQQLLGFARRGKNQNIPVDVHAVAREVASLLRRTAGSNIAICEEFEASNPWILGDPEQLQQVVLNLAVNARDAMPRGGEMTFGTASAPFSDPSRADGAPHLEFFVRDTGCGIPEEAREQIFDPFFTTKEQGKGTGMGLPMVYGIVKNHGGFVRFDTEVGRGTTFRIFLPLTEVPAGAEPAADETPAVAGRGRVLVVDDEEVVREVAAQYLLVLGYDVLTARDGVEAVELYRRHGGAIDLVLIDMMMPRMDGRDCFRALKAMNPEVRAILSTGFGMNSAAQEVLDEGVAGFVQKPYGIQQLAEAVARVLQRAPLTTGALRD